MVFDGGNIRFVIISKLTVCTIGNSVSPAKVPDKAVFVVGYLPRSLGIVKASAVSIAGRPVFFKKIGGVSSRAPIVTIRAHFAIHIKVIEQYKLAGKGMLVGGIFFSEQKQTRVAISACHI